MDAYSGTLRIRILSSLQSLSKEICIGRGNDKDVFYVDFQLVIEKHRESKKNGLSILSSIFFDSQRLQLMKNYSRRRLSLG